MTTAAIRERLYDYIRVADDKKVVAIYTPLEEQIAPQFISRKIKNLWLN
jgi:hypothetical protein